MSPVRCSSSLLAVQFRLRRYVPGVYWSVVVVISVFGTLITDNLTDAYNVPLTTSTIVFASSSRWSSLAGALVERTLSIHTIYHHPPRGLLLAGDPVHVRPRHRGRRPHRREVRPRATRSRSSSSAAPSPSSPSAHFGSSLNAVLAFWLAYILTRPLGASIGDGMSQPSHTYGGLGLGTTSDQLHLPRLHPRAGDVPLDHQARPDPAIDALARGRLSVSALSLTRRPPWPCPARSPSSGGGPGGRRGGAGRGAASARPRAAAWRG